MATLAALDGGSGAARAQLRAAAPSAGLDSSAASVRRASPARREGGRCRHSAPPSHTSTTTSTRGKRLQWNSCCSATRWITAPSPRPFDQPSTGDTATTTTTTAPKTPAIRGSSQHEDTPSLYGTDPQQHPQQHLAPPTRAAQQVAALILVAAQHDITRRDSVIDTLRGRWWQQLGSSAIHRTRIRAQHRQLRAVRCAHMKSQQLAAQELKLENAVRTESIERLQVQLQDWHREQAAANTSKQLREEQRATEQRQLVEQHSAAIHVLSTQLMESERQWRHWKHKANELEQQIKALQQQYDQELEFGAELQHKFGALQQKHDDSLDYSVKSQSQIGRLYDELHRLERDGARVDWWRI